MIPRLGGVFIVLFWSASMTWLLWHDIWPGLTAGDPPVGANLVSAESGPISHQFAILDQYEHRIGTAWTAFGAKGDASFRQDFFFIERFLNLPPILIAVDSDFLADGQLQEFHLSVHGLDMRIEIDGERFASMYGFNIRAGQIKDRLRIDADSAGLIGDVFRPFSALPGLKVGQSWRMQVVNPLAVITGFGSRFVSMLARVTRAETITTSQGETVDCLVVEAPNVTAWVNKRGKVLVQKVELPVGGTITVRDEAYDDDALQTAKRAVPRSRIDPYD